ncbi:DUF3810 domain-containing protein [Tersicoccus sp. Bi-70]|uniref:DUF3810 domain-containing protein n=1 Tax=Tersicoccus sp. Bi-70 TaxID=1897634 RepID=UPI0011811847|nr:DUF3810 domain-containing protein [Tersicoccus sp. Bi-70]
MLAAVISAFRFPLGSAFLVALIVYAVVLAVPLVRSVKQDVRLRRAGKRTGLASPLQWLVFLPITLFTTEFQRLLMRAGMDEWASLVLMVVVAVVTGLAIGWIVRRFQRRARTDPAPDD